MTTDPAGREQRRQELSHLTRRQLVRIHHQGAGCLMTQAELLRWNHEELETAILDAEFGPRPTTQTTDQEDDQ